MLLRSQFSGIATGTVLGLALVACVPIFSGGLFQTLGISFEFSEAIGQGEERVVHSSVFPESVRLKKNFVRVSGRLSGESLPGNVTLKAEIGEDGGKTTQRLTLRLKIGDDGTFRGSAKIKKNIAAGEAMTVSITPSGSDLDEGTQIQLCVDVVRKRSDLASLPDCVEASGGDGGGGGGDPGATFSSLQNDFLNLSCARSGCHSATSASAGLVLDPGVAYGNLVNTPSSQQPGLNRVTPNDPDNSYLIKKLRGDPDINGDRMPRGGPFLTDEQLARFVAWINSGAPNN